MSERRSLKSADLVAKMRAKTDEALKVITEVLDGHHGASVKDRLEAAKIVLNRGWGREPLQVELGLALEKAGGAAAIEAGAMEVLRKRLARGAEVPEELAPVARALLAAPAEDTE